MNIENNEIDIEIKKNNTLPPFLSRNHIYMHIQIIFFIIDFFKELWNSFLLFSG
jgi:hypothetical protein